MSGETRNNKVHFVVVEAGFHWRDMVVAFACRGHGANDFETLLDIPPVGFTSASTCSWFLNEADF